MTTQSKTCKGNGRNKVISNSRRRTFLLFSLPGLLIYSIFLIYPIFLGIYYSLTDFNGVGKQYTFIGLDNFKKVLTKYPRFTNSLLYTGRHALMYVVCIIVIGIALALLLNMKIKGITFFRGMLYIPAVLCGMTISLIFGQVFTKILPPLGELLGIPILANVLGTRESAPIAILFVCVWQGVALPTVLFLAGLQTIPMDLYESAMIDGANAFHRFRYITIPFLVPVITIVLILSLKGGLGVFSTIKALTDGGPVRSTESASFLIYYDAFFNKKFSLAIAESLIMGAILAAVSIVNIILQNKVKVEV